MTIQECNIGDIVECIVAENTCNNDHILRNKKNKFRIYKKTTELIYLICIDSEILMTKGNTYGGCYPTRFQLANLESPEINLEDNKHLTYI